MSTGSGGATIEVPRTIGSVKLVREIGHGGMGVVWLGRDEMLERDVAVKFLLRAVAGPDDKGFEAFLEGARAAASVQHAGLNTIHHAGIIESFPYLVMEYIDGPTLADLIRQTSPLDPELLGVVLDTVCGALSALHERGIVHRDIKPANILIDRDGHLYVTDFGLACQRPIGQSSVEGLAGTCPYMAPEMFDGTISARSDVYALGMMSYELLAGSAPFRGTLDEVEQLHRTQDLPPLPGVDDAVVEVIHRATYKETMFRYKTAAHFLQGYVEAVGTPTDRDRKRFAARLGGDVRASGEATDGSDSTSYYDTLSSIAERKRTEFPESPPREEEVEETRGSVVVPAGATALFVFFVLLFTLLSTRTFITIGLWHLASALGALEGTEVVVIGNSEFQGPLVWWAGIAIPLIVGTITYVPAFVAGLIAYDHIVFGTFRPDGFTRCGACGYVLRALKRPACPDCGKDI